MKKSLLLLCCAAAIALTGRLWAEDPPATERALLGPEQIENLVSPIALYPDPLVALILPASTHPADVVLAARFLTRGDDPAATGAELWDGSVKSLARYREVIDYLDRNLDWTRSLGECFLDQPDDVMASIQRVRARARANGLLADSREQEVVVEADEIRIVPADPTIIYVPHYDPQVIFVSSSAPFYRPAAWLTFGIGYGVGAWLNYDCDWRYRSVRITQRHPSWYHRPDWRHRPDYPAAWTRWTPPPRHRDRPRHTPNFMPRYDSTWLNGRPPAAPPAINEPRRDDGRRERWQNPPGQPDSNRDRSAGGESRRRRPRENHPDNMTPAAPAVAATVPTAPPAPVTATSPQPAPGRPNYVGRHPDTRRHDRNDGEARRYTPRGDGERQAAPPQPATVQRPSFQPQPPPVREAPRRENSERTVRSDRVEDNRQQLN